MAWQKITEENIGLIQQGDKVATGFPRSIIHSDSKTQAELIEKEDIKIFIVEKVNRVSDTDSLAIDLMKTIWSFSLTETTHVTTEELLEKWWWKKA